MSRSILHEADFAVLRALTATYGVPSMLSALGDAMRHMSADYALTCAVLDRLARGRPADWIGGGGDDPAPMGALIRAACRAAVEAGRFVNDAAIIRAIAAQEGQLERVASASFYRAVKRPDAAASTVRAVCGVLGLEVRLVPREGGR